MEKETNKTEKAGITKLFDSPGYSGAKIVGEPKIVLAEEERQKLRTLLDTETAATELLAKACLRLDDAKDHARQSQKSRDELCLALEKKYEIAGKKWTVDFETGEIKVGN